jgi:hypothetical protein
MKWPKSVTVVTADDMTTHSFVRGQKMCALGHLNREIHGNPQKRVVGPKRETFEVAYRTAAAIVLGRSDLHLFSIVVINDTIATNNEQRAAILNLTWEILGYDVQNAK